MVLATKWGKKIFLITSCSAIYFFKRSFKCDRTVPMSLEGFRRCIIVDYARKNTYKQQLYVIDLSGSFVSMQNFFAFLWQTIFDCSAKRRQDKVFLLFIYWKSVVKVDWKKLLVLHWRETVFIQTTFFLLQVFYSILSKFQDKNWPKIRQMQYFGFAC